MRGRSGLLGRCIVGLDHLRYIFDVAGDLGAGPALFPERIGNVADDADHLVGAELDFPFWMKHRWNF